MAELTENNNQLFEDISLSSDDIQTRDISLSDLWLSLREGYADYGMKSGSIQLAILFYFVAALVIVLFSSGQPIRYLAFPMVAGFNLLGPIVATGYLEMSRRRQQGLPSTWRHCFNFIHTHSFAPVLALSLLMMFLYVAWLYMAELIFFGTFGDSNPESFAAFFDELFSTQHGTALIAYGNFVGFLFASSALALSVVAFPLVLDKPVTAFTAIKVSIRAVWTNTFVMAVWGAVVVALLTVGAAIFLIGLAVALPILGHATWHLYRKIVV
jgi:uncharacterized membrane protein